jgi:hypothetical protein
MEQEEGTIRMLEDGKVYIHQNLEKVFRISALYKEAMRREEAEIKDKTSIDISSFITLRNSQPILVAAMLACLHQLFRGTCLA